MNSLKTAFADIFREIMNTVFKSHAGNMSANTENFIVVVVVFLLLFFCLFLDISACVNMRKWHNSYLAFETLHFYHFLELCHLECYFWLLFTRF